MIQKIPGRRGGAKAASAPDTHRLTVKVSEIYGVRDEILAIYQKLGLADVAVSAEGDLTLVIDTHVMMLIALYVNALRRSVRVAKEAQADADVLEAQHRRARALGALLVVLQQFEGELSGTRLIVAAAQGRKWAELVQGLMHKLASGELSPADVATLKSQSRELLAQAETEAAQQKERREELKGARAAAQAKVEEAQARRRRLQGLLNLQEQQEIDPELLDELVRVYHTRVEVPRDEQRRAQR